MNSRQKKTLVVGGSLIALMLLFPPWEYFDPDSSGRIEAGYHFFLKPPVPQRERLKHVVRFPEIVRVRMNEVRLIIQLVITIPTVVGLVFLFEPKRHPITIAFGIICLLIPVLIVGFVVWVVVSEGLEYGHWPWS
jgi:hypothetical protein